MSTAAPPAPHAGASTEKKQPALPGTEHANGGKQKSIDGKQTIKEPADPKVRKAAEEYANLLDNMDDGMDELQEAGARLLKSFLESKKARKVTVESRHGRRTFTTATLTKLVKTREQTDK